LQTAQQFISQAVN